MATSTKNNSETVFISKDAMKRIISDIKELRNNPLTEHGIYYEHDDEDILKGKALIIGPRDTPYENGFYLFEFKFPADYPHSPPTLTFCTSDGHTRFNPNLYRCGKVCLSILNTWDGDQWSACQTISSILLAICTILTKDPLLNEPGITRDHRDFKKYTRIIRFKNISVAIFDMLNSEKIQKRFAKFKTIMNEHFLREKENIREKVKAFAESTDIMDVRTGVYEMSAIIDYNSLLKQFD